MKIAENFYKAAAARWEAIGRRGKILLVLLSVASIGGLCWLIMAESEDLVAVSTKKMPIEEISVAQTILSENDIPSKIAGNRLFVSRRHLLEAKRILTAGGSKGSDSTMSAFEELARQDDIWRTSSQNDKRWQAAKMVTLSKLVAMFPSVASATVIYEPGSDRRLGQSGNEPTAAVRVTMKEGQTLTRSMAMAIADLIAGSIAGMSSKNVRIIDSSGQSFRFDESLTVVDKELQQRRAMESYYQEKIREALQYAGKVVVGVSMPAGGQGPMTVSVAVPRSHLQAIEAAGGGKESALDGNGNLIGRQIAQIQQTVARIVGAAGADTKVDWYQDVISPQTKATTEESASAGSMRLLGFGTMAALSGLAGAAICMCLMRVRLRKEKTKSAYIGETENKQTVSADQGENRRQVGEKSRPFAFLDDLTGDEILSLVGNEHPQAIAIVLSQLSPSRAAAVLTGLEGDVQAEVARRLANIEQVDQTLVAEVEAAMAQRTAAAPRKDKDIAGEAQVAEILRHAGYATEKTVLTNLSSHSSALADSIRRRMFTFDDLVHLPAQRLAAALAKVPKTELAVALRTASVEMVQKVLAALGGEAAKAVRSEMEQMGPVRLIEVEAAQQSVAEHVRRMEMGQYASDGQKSVRQMLA